MLLIFFQGRGIVTVDSYEPNRYGIYNMVGNVAEMCTDVYGNILLSGVDPYMSGSQVKKARFVVKGGAWYGFANDVQISMRGASVPITVNDYDATGSGTGFRVVRNPY